MHSKLFDAIIVFLHSELIGGHWYSCSQLFGPPRYTINVLINVKIINMYYVSLN